MTLYVAAQKNGGADVISMFKSVDGATWTWLASLRQSPTTTNANSVHMLLDANGTDIHVATGNNASSDSQARVLYHKFDTVTETWTTTNELVLLTASNTYYAYGGIVQRSTGELVVVMQNGVPAIHANTKPSAGTWGTQFTVQSTGLGFDKATIQLGDSDRVHVVHSDASNYLAVSTIRSDNTLTARYAPATLQQSALGHSTSYLDGGATTIAVPYERSATIDAGYTTFVSSETPTFSAEENPVDLDLEDYDMTLGMSAGVMYYVYQTDVTSDTIEYVRRVNGAWTSPANVLVTNALGSGNIHLTASPTEHHILYRNNTSFSATIENYSYTSIVTQSIVTLGGSANAASSASAILGVKQQTAVRTSFPCPDHYPSGSQEFRVLVRRQGANLDPLCTVELWEKGSFVTTVVAATAVSSTTGVVLSGTFNASLLTNTSGHDVECRVFGDGYDDGALEVGAIEWNATVDTLTNNLLCGYTTPNSTQASGDLTDAPVIVSLDGSASSASSATATISSTASLAARGDAASSATAVQYVARGLASTANTSSDATSGLSATYSIISAASTASSATGNLRLGIAFGASAPASGDASAAFSVQRSLDGSGNSAAEASAVLRVDVLVQASSPSASGISGVLGTTRVIAGSSSAALEATATASTVRFLASSASAASSSTGVLNYTASFASSVNTAASAVGTLEISATTVPIDGSASSASQASAGLSGTLSVGGSSAASSDAGGAASLSLLLASASNSANTTSGVARVDWMLTATADASVDSSATMEATRNVSGRVDAAASSVAVADASRNITSSSSSANSASGALTVSRLLIAVASSASSAVGNATYTEEFIASAASAMDASALLRIDLAFAATGQSAADSEGSISIYYPQRLAPDYMLGLIALSGSLSDIQDDPDSPDTNWLVNA